jgi:hypothetical protein
MGRKPKPRYDLATVVVPFVVAVLALAGVVIAALINAGDDTPSTGNGGPTTPSVQIVIWGSRTIGPPPRLLLQFRGKSSGLGSGSRVFVLAQFGRRPHVPSAHRELDVGYHVSPPAHPEPDGSWEITWELSDVPESASYQAVTARAAPAYTCIQPPCGPPTEILLRESGPNASIVTAVDRADTPPASLPLPPR